MKWFQLAQLLAPILGVVIPGAGPVVPFILAGIHDAQAIHGDTNNSAKKALVYDAVSAAVASGKVNIPQQAATQLTDAVFQSIDNVQVIAKANDTTPATQAAPVAGTQTAPTV